MAVPSEKEFRQFTIRLSPPLSGFIRFLLPSSPSPLVVVKRAGCESHSRPRLSLCLFSPPAFTLPFSLRALLAAAHMFCADISLSSNFSEFVTRLKSGVSHNCFQKSPSKLNKCNQYITPSVRIALCLPESCRGNKDIGNVISAVTNDVIHVCGVECTGPAKERKTQFWVLKWVIVENLLSVHSSGFLVLLVSLAVTAILVKFFIGEKKTTGW